MSGWNEDMATAPRGEDVLVAMSTYADDGTGATMIGMLIFEPMEREPDDTDEDDEGYWGEHNGEVGIYYWHANDADGHVPKKWLKAWQPVPEPFKANQK